MTSVACAAFGPCLRQLAPEFTSTVNHGPCRGALPAAAAAERMRGGAPRCSRVDGMVALAAPVVPPGRRLPAVAAGDEGAAGGRAATIGADALWGALRDPSLCGTTAKGLFRSLLPTLKAEGVSAEASSGKHQRFLLAENGAAGRVALFLGWAKALPLRKKLR